MQLNALSRLQRYLGKPEKGVIVNNALLAIVLFMQILTIAHWSGILKTLPENSP